MRGNRQREERERRASRHSAWRSACLMKGKRLPLTQTGDWKREKEDCCAGGAAGFVSRRIAMQSPASPHSLPDSFSKCDSLCVARCCNCADSEEVFPRFQLLQSPESDLFAKSARESYLSGGVEGLLHMQLQKGDCKSRSASVFTVQFAAAIDRLLDRQEIVSLSSGQKHWHREKEQE